MAQVSNLQSRTLRVIGSLSDTVKNALSALNNVVVLEKVTNDSPKTFVTGEDVSALVQVLTSNSLLFRPHFYSLFVKFNDELKSTEVSKLNDRVLALVPNAVVSYSRVDSNGHTGKVVVDRFDDYNALRSATGDTTFYKFNRTKAQARSGPATGPATTGEDGFTTVRRRTMRPGTSEGETVPRRAQYGDRRQPSGDRRQPSGDRAQSSGDRRQTGGDRAQSSGDGRQTGGARTWANKAGAKPTSSTV